MKTAVMTSRAAATFCTAVLLISSCYLAAAVPGAEDFDYKKSGMDWKGSCREGKRQSPINIVNELVVQGDPVDLRFHYEEASWITVRHDGRVLVAQVNSTNNVMETPEGNFTLKQFHFHAISEHSIDGVFAPLEAHFVHFDPSGTKASVFAVFFRLRKDDIDNPYLNPYFPQPGMSEKLMPTTTKDRFTFLLSIKDLIQPPTKGRNFLSFFHYTGSLTTPPCTEMVSWYVRRRTSPISIRQLTVALQINEDVAGERFDNRLPQPLYGRKIIYHQVY